MEDFAYADDDTYNTGSTWSDDTIFVAPGSDTRNEDDHCVRDDRIQNTIAAGGNPESGDDERRQSPHFSDATKLAAATTRLAAACRGTQSRRRQAEAAAAELLSQLEVQGDEANQLIDLAEEELAQDQTAAQDGAEEEDTFNEENAQHRGGVAASAVVFKVEVGAWLDIWREAPPSGGTSSWKRGVISDVTQDGTSEQYLIRFLDDDAEEWCELHEGWYQPVEDEEEDYE